MDLITFRCKSCGTLLKARADLAGCKCRCKRCGTVGLLPRRVPTEAEENDEPVVAELVEEDEQPEPVEDDTYEVTRPQESVSASRRRRPPRPSTRNRSVELRSAPGWRKVRLGLMLIGLSIASGLVFSLLAPIFFGGVGLVFQSLPIAGYVLCAFVPVKGVARNLALANLGVIAVGLTMMIIALGMTARPADRSSELRQKISTTNLEPSTEEKELGKKRAELRKQLDQRKKDASKLEKELKQTRWPDKKALDLSKKLSAEVEETKKQLEEVDRQYGDLSKKRLEEIQEASRKRLAELKAASAEALEEFKGFWGWIRTSIQWFLLQWCLQIVLVCYFIRAITPEFSDRIEASSWMEDFLEWWAFGPGTWLAKLIALGLGEKDLVRACPRVALAALLTVTLILLSQILPISVMTEVSPKVWVVFWWVILVLGIVTVIWQELVLIEACFIIGKHLRPPSQEEHPAW
jgi:hypothetical protein